MGCAKQTTTGSDHYASFSRVELEAVYGMGCQFRRNEGWPHDGHLRSPVPDGVVICCADERRLDAVGAMARAYKRLEGRTGHTYPTARVSEADGDRKCHWIPRSDIVNEALTESAPILPVQAIQTMLDTFVKRGTVECMDRDVSKAVHRRTAQELIERGRMTRNPETGRLVYV